MRLELASLDAVAAACCASLTSHLAKSQLVAMRGMRRVAWSLAAVNPTVAFDLSTEEKGLAPAFSRLRRMTAEERPDPDLKLRNLLASAAPLSDELSLDDPAEG